MSGECGVGEFSITRKFLVYVKSTFGLSFKAHSILKAETVSG